MEHLIESSKVSITNNTNCTLEVRYSGPDAKILEIAAGFFFGIMTYQTNQNHRQIEMLIYGALAILFQPFFKISLGRELWNLVDVVVGVGLLLSLARNTNKE